MTRSRWIHTLGALAAPALLALPFLLYRGALGLWWSEDDFFQLRYALGHAPLAYGLDPEVWRLLPNRVLSPLLFASYDLDLALFGVEPAPFYAHQLLAIGAAAALLYAVLRLWLAPAWAVVGGLALLLGAPTASLASHLMVRHYPEAIALGLAAAGLWVLAVRSGTRPKTVALTAGSTLLYLAASLAKEIAVPLPLLLVLLPEGSHRRRLKLLVPHGVVLVLYAAYRAWMLGTPVGGYGFATTAADGPRLALALPWKVARELAAGSAWGWAWLALATAAALVAATRSRRAGLLLLAGLALALGPVLPVSAEMTPRYAVTAWLVLAAALPFGLRAFGRVRKALAAVSSIVALAIGLAACLTAWAGPGGFLPRAERRSTEARGLLALGRGDLLRAPASPPASLDQLRRFAAEVLDRPVEAGWFYDDLFLCDPETGAPAPSDAQVFAYAPSSGRLEEITGEVPSRARRYCGAIDRSAPLAARLWADGAAGGRVLRWDLGPYENGRYAFVLDDGRLRYDFPGDLGREGAFHVGGLRRIALRVRHESPDGRVTYSPELEVDLTPGSPPVRWRR